MAMLRRGPNMPRGVELHRRWVHRVPPTNASASLIRANTANLPILERVYMQHVQDGVIAHDAVQFRALQRASLLLQQLAGYEGPHETKPHWWQPWHLHGTKHDAPKGLYLHGGVGCGKTFVMDLFFEHVAVEKKRRVHFHEFMLNVHREMHQLREAGCHEDPIPRIADHLLATSWLLCFDEFHVNDVADALILRRLFSVLLSRGFVMVATSNVSPHDLYEHGLQRELFLPFIDMLTSKCDILSLEDSHTDYRAQKASRAISPYACIRISTIWNVLTLVYAYAQGEHHAKNVFVSPVNAASAAIFDQEFTKRCHGETTAAASVMADGRQIAIQQAAVQSRVCQMSFEELCEMPHSAADYLALAARFDVIFLRDIPKLDEAHRSAMHRFIIFVDCMYDEDRMLYCLAEAEPSALFEVDRSRIEEAVAIDRCVSRLQEMQSEVYARLHADSAADTHQLAA